VIIRPAECLPCRLPLELPRQKVLGLLCHQFSILFQTGHTITALFPGYVWVAILCFILLLLETCIVLLLAESVVTLISNCSGQ
jgi:hypothetical protein